MDVKLELDDPPIREEIKKATMQLKVGKSPGIDGIPAEVYQHGGVVLDKLQDLFTNCWEKGTLPQDIRDAVIVSLYKNKGEKSDCSNTEASLCSPLQAKSWFMSHGTVSSQQQHRKTRQKASVGSALMERRQT